MEDVLQKKLSVKTCFESRKKFRMRVILLSILRRILLLHVD